MYFSLLLVIIAIVVQFVLGAFWYSPVMFGKWWMEIMEATHFSKEDLKSMQKKMIPFYVVQFLMTILFTFALTLFIGVLPFNAYLTSMLIFLGFILPIQVSGVIWGNTKKKFWVKQIFILASFQLIAIVIATFIIAR